MISTHNLFLQIPVIYALCMVYYEWSSPTDVQLWGKSILWWWAVWYSTNSSNKEYIDDEGEENNAGGPKHPLFRKGKPVTLFQLNWLYKIMGKIFCPFQKHSNYSSEKKWWKKHALQRLIKQKLFSVAQVTTRKIAGCYTQRTVRIYRNSHSNRVKFWKRLHLDKTWTSNKLCTTFFHSSNVKGQVIISWFVSFISATRTSWRQREYQSVFWFTSFDNAETRQNHTSATKDKLDAICSIFDQFSQACT